MRPMALIAQTRSCDLPLKLCYDMLWSACAKMEVMHEFSA